MLPWVTRQCPVSAHVSGNSGDVHIPMWLQRQRGVSVAHFRGLESWPPARSRLSGTESLPLRLGGDLSEGLSGRSAVLLCYLETPSQGTD